MAEFDLRKALARLYSLRPFPLVERAWHYDAKTAEGTVQHVVRFSSVGDHLILLPCKEGFDAELAADVLRLVGDVPPDFFDEKPIQLFDGLAATAKSFTRILALGPHAHTQFEAANPELQERTVIIFPAYASEFSGDEEPSLMRTLRKYFVSTLNWQRLPQPRIWMMHRNAATGSRSPGQKRGLARLDKCLREIESLSEGEGSFVEVENLLGNVMRLTKRAGQYDLEFPEGKAPPRTVATAQAIDLVGKMVGVLGPCISVEKEAV